LPAEINYAVEGYVDAAVARRLIQHCGGIPGLERVTGGKTKLDPLIPKYVASARMLPWLILRDLDFDAACPVEMRAALSQEVAELLCLRVVVREVEAWLLADGDALSEFLRVRPGLMPAAPESLRDPKQTLVNLARRSSSSAIRAAMVPTRSSGAQEGPEFASYLTEFVETHWRPAVAAADIDSSLSRALRCLTRLVQRSDPQIQPALI
jgi:hypothetical protein